MPCDACGCACAYGGRGVVAPMEVDDDEEQQLAAPLLLDLEAAAAVGSKLAAAAAADDDDHTTPGVTEKMAAVLSGIQVYWVFLFLLWVYLLNWARRFTLTYTDGSIWFTTFAVMVTAIPLTELFYMIVVHVEETREEIRKEKEEEPPPPPPPAAADAGARERIVTTDDDDAGTEASREREEKIGRCILRGLLVLAWLFVIDFGRRVLGEVELLLPAIFMVSYLVITATSLLVMAGLYIEGLPPVVSQT